MTMGHLLATLRRLFRAQNGATAVEMALVGPMFFAFMIGTMEVAVVMFTNVAIEAAVRDGARYGVTGNSQGGVSREDRLREIISERTLGLVQPTSEDITMKVYPNFAAAGIDAKSLAGRRLLARGTLAWRNGPMIEASHPEQLELLPDGPSQGM